MEEFKYLETVLSKYGDRHGGRTEGEGSARGQVRWSNEKSEGRNVSTEVKRGSRGKDTHKNKKRTRKKSQVIPQYYAHLLSNK